MVSMLLDINCLEDLPMTSRSDEVKKDVHTIIPESRITLNARLFRENVIVLSLEVSNDF